MAIILPRLADAPIEPGDVVLVRIDCNVPLNSDGSIGDTFRLEAVTPTLKYLRDLGARVVIAGAIGRPKGKRDSSLSTKCIAEYFDKNLFKNCHHVDEAIGEKVFDATENCENGDAIMIENLRFWIEEESNDDEFAQELASQADFYVNDAFGQSHRNQASIVAITKYIPSFAGVCLEKEVDALQNVLETGESPVVGIIGGAKVSDKLQVIEALLDRCESLIIGGAMAYTFLKSQGVKIGNSLCEDDFLDKASELIKSGKIVLPEDSVVANNINSTDVAVSESIEDGYSGFDIGPSSISKFEKVIAGARTILWNGPMGVFENEQFSQGTKSIGEAVANANAYSVVGGGDSVAAIRSMKLEDRIDHVSTGGGATLEYIETGTLVGVQALIN